MSKIDVSKKILLTNVILNLLTLLSASLAAIAKTAPLWYGGGNNKEIYESMDVLATVLTPILFLASWWTNKKINKVAHQNEKIRDEEIFKAKSQIAIFESKAEEFRAKTERYRLEYENLKASISWREISSEQVKSIRESLKDIDSIVNVVIDVSDPEAQRYGRQFSNLFSSMNKGGFEARSTINHEGLVLIGVNSEITKKIEVAFADVNIHIVVVNKKLNIYPGSILLSVGKKGMPRVNDLD